MYVGILSCYLFPSGCPQKIHTAPDLALEMANLLILKNFTRFGAAPILHALRCALKVLYALRAAKSLAMVGKRGEG